MKKRNPNLESEVEITPEQAVKFLEDFRLMVSEKDEKTQLISLRVPGNILRMIKLRAKNSGKKYQSLMIDYLRQGLKAEK